MDSRWRCTAALLLALTSGCHAKATAQAAVAEQIVPAVVAVRTTVQELLPPKATVPAPLATRIVDPSVDIASRLILRWEITSQRVYERKYMGIVCPPSPSGPTWGVGYDGGTQTALDIGRDWREHPQVEDLKTTSGQVAAKCAPSKARLGHIRTRYALAYGVFRDSTLPSYKAAARRRLGASYDSLSPQHQAGLDDLGYNRGWSLLGSRREEMREIVQVCVPALDAQCTATQLRKMCRLWPDTPGLCNRRLDEATVVTSN